ncbi:hypothetical protein BD779DRAFT_1472851 [Infundibulicybe gibba]|nr:hypothetical protein BD779DRAFT_1472851 [Infundibulicybe gibba]
MTKNSHSEGPEAPEEKAFSSFFVSSWGKTHDGKPNAPVDDEWSDLLLELTLAAAYSSLIVRYIANGPKGGVLIFWNQAAVSFIAYFALVWWIWASQVAYNTRFRTRDWVHRLFSGAQFVVFCAMATFSNFSIETTSGGSLDSSGSSSVGPIDYNLSSNTLDGFYSSNERQWRLPLINCIGIAVTMGCSRIFLCIQYFLIFVTANPRPKRLLWYIIGLLVSSGIYFGSALYIHFSLKTGVPILLWFIPVILEVLIHMAVVRIRSHDYDSKSIAKRSATLFIVVLGEGLNQIVGTFKYVIGDVGMTWRGPLIMLCVGGLSSANFRSIAVIIGKSTAVNMYSELHTVLGMMNGIIKNPPAATPLMITDAWRAFLGLGIPFDGFMDKAKNAFANPQNSTAQTQLAQAVIYVASVTMNEFNAFPSSGSPLFNQTETFLSSPDSDPTTALPLLSELLSSNLVLARWFWGFAGASLIILAFLHLMIRVPKDIFETLGILSRFTMGAVFLGLTAITFDNVSPWFDRSDGITADMHHSWFEAWV